jgi:adenylate cyclase
MLRLDTDPLKYLQTRMPLSVSIGTLVSVLLLIVTGTLVTVDQYQGRNLALAQATENFEHTSRSISLEIAQILTPIEVAVKGGVATLERMDREEILIEDNFHYLADKLRSSANLYSIYYADRPGDFIMASRGAIAQPTTDGSSPFTGWIIRRGANGSVDQRVYALDDEGNVLTTDNRYNNGYDPRLRDWYQLAIASDRFVQSPPYLFFSVREVGLTMAQRMSDQSGVVGGDVMLGTMGEALSRYRGSANFRSIMFEKLGEVVASDEPAWVTSVHRANDRPVVRRQTLASVGSPATTALSNLVASGFRQGLAIVSSSDGVEWAIWLRDIAVGTLEGRRLAVLVPTSELFAEVNRRGLVGLGIAGLGILIGLIFAWQLGRSVARPVARLTGYAGRLRTFDLADQPRVRSVISEIVDLDEAMYSMRAALRNFAIYVPRQLVRLLVTGRLTAEIRGERQEITLLFTDVEGFTTISESVDAVTLTRDMSEYLGALSHALIENGATVDKFIGDAVMAFWNAPEEQPDHVAIACHAALRAKWVVEVFNRRRRDEGLYEFRTRFGLHMGTAVVGTVGSEERGNYTALGAVVNLASRLEGTNKIFGTTILISDDVRERIGPEFVTRPVDLIMAKGTLNAVRIHELIGLAGAEPELYPGEDALAMAEAWKGVAATYEKRDWLTTVRALDAHLERWPDDGVAREMLHRATDYILDPPPEDWDGVERLHSK